MGVQERVSEALNSLKEQGVSYTHIGKKIGVTEGTVRNWITGKSEPSVSELPKIASLCQKSMTWFYGGDSASLPLEESLSRFGITAEYLLQRFPGLAEFGNPTPTAESTSVSPTATIPRTTAAPTGTMGSLEEINLLRKLTAVQDKHIDMLQERYIELSADIRSQNIVIAGLWENIAEREREIDDMLAKDGFQPKYGSSMAAENATKLREREDGIREFEEHLKRQESEKRAANTGVSGSELVSKGYIEALKAQLAPTPREPSARELTVSPPDVGKGAKQKAAGGGSKSGRGGVTV